MQTFLPFIYQVFGVFAYFSSALLSESKRSIKKAFQPVETRDSES